MNVEDFLKTKKPIIKNIKYKITRIKEKENGVIIYLDNKEKINISVDIYFKYAISSIRGLDDDLYEILKNEEILYLAYVGALRKLSAKDYTRKQIEDYLKIKKGLDESQVKTIIDKLIKYSLLDDEKYCLNRANYLNKQLLSIKQIKNRLSKEGISKELIEKYVINNSEEEYFKAEKLAKKYSNSIKNKSLNAIKQSLLTKIVNAGYSYDNAKQAINSLNLVSNNEIDLLKKEYIKAVNKYSRKFENYELENHVYSYLINKGFKSDDIKSVMEV